MGLTSDWQHRFICKCSFCNWFPDMQMVLLMENSNHNRSIDNDDRWRNFKEKGQERIDYKNWKKRDRKKIKGLKEERKWTEEKENKFTDLRSLKLMECTPAGQSTPTVHGLRNYIKKINYNLSPTLYNQKDCLCLCHYQGSQNKHLPNGQCTPMVQAYSLQIALSIQVHNCT